VRRQRNPRPQSHTLGDDIGIQTLPAFLMQWLPPENVLRAIETAQSARFEFGQTPKLLPFVKQA